MPDNITNEPKCPHCKTWTCKGMKSPLCNECVVTLLKQKYAEGELRWRQNNEVTDVL